MIVQHVDTTLPTQGSIIISEIRVSDLNFTPGSWWSVITQVCNRLASYSDAYCFEEHYLK